MQNRISLNELCNPIFPIDNDAVEISHYCSLNVFSNTPLLLAKIGKHLQLSLLEIKPSTLIIDLGLGNRKIKFMSSFAVIERLIVFFHMPHSLTLTHTHTLTHIHRSIFQMRIYWHFLKVAIIAAVVHNELLD